MRAWLTADKPYRWVGYYLSAPCHSDSSWEGKRQTLSEMGWGMAVIYVGQQTWGKTPGQKVAVTRYVTKRVRTTVKLKSGRKVVRYVKRRGPRRGFGAPPAATRGPRSHQPPRAGGGTPRSDDGPR